jgi:hypothetical protein
MKTRASLGAVVAALTIGAAVRAEGRAVTVERETGADDCPDSAALNARVDAIRGQVIAADAMPYRVTFGRGARGLTAVIRSEGGSAGVRRLEAHEASCAGLAHAAAVALAVLLDTEAAAPREEAKPKEPQPHPAAVPPPPPNAATPVEREPSMAPVFSVGAAALVGVLRPVALSFVADAGLEKGRLRGTLGVLWATPQTLELGPGSVRANLVSGALRVCFAFWQRAWFRADACSGVFAGAASAEARGFTTNERHTKLFLAFLLEMALSARTGVVGWQLGAAALLPVPPNEFDIVGVGSTYRPPPVAGMFSFRVTLEPAR